MDRRTFLFAIVIGSGASLLAASGCAPAGMDAEQAKRQCFDNQAKIRQMFALFNADSGEYPPIDVVVEKLGVKCPSGGKYLFDADTSTVSCSVHGSG